MSSFIWRSENDDPAPSTFSPVDDRLKADTALSLVKRGEYLLYEGDFQNAKQLLSAMGRRLPSQKSKGTPAEAFRAERKMRQLEQQTLSRIVVNLDGNYKLSLARAPDVAEACRQVWGAPEAGARTVVALKQLLGMLGAAEWRKKGLEVPGLEGRIHPHYGVYSPTRSDYLELLLHLREIEGKQVFDIGTGTGILSFLLLQRGAAKATATDIDARAIVCARENAERLGLAARFEALEAHLFPPGKADLVVSNPPWVPEAPKNRVDRAVFDEGSQFVSGFLKGLEAHLAPGGRGVLILSNLAVHLGLRSATWLEEEIARAGLEVTWKRSTKARHDRAKDPTDPLHVARAKEITTLYVLVPTTELR